MSAVCEVAWHCGCIQLTPWKRSTDGSIICVGVDDLIGVAVPPLVRPLLPKLRSIQVGGRYTKQREGCNGQWQFKGHHPQEHLWGLPLARDGREARSESHVRMRVLGEQVSALSNSCSQPLTGGVLVYSELSQDLLDCDRG